MDMEMVLNDRELITQYRTCDPKPFETLFKKYHKYVFHVFIKKGVSYDEAEDCCQDIWTAFARTLKTVQLRHSFKSFLNRAITNRTMDYFRRLYNKIKKEINIFMDLPSDNEGFGIRLIDVLQNEEGNVLDQFIKKDLLKHLRKCIQEIKNEKQRTAICLWFDDYSYEEIANLMEVTMGTVSAWISRSKEVIRVCMIKISGS